MVHQIGGLCASTLAFWKPAIKETSQEFREQFHHTYSPYQTNEPVIIARSTLIISLALPIFVSLPTLIAPISTPFIFGFTFTYLSREMKRAERAAEQRNDELAFQELFNSQEVFINTSLITRVAQSVFCLQKLSQLQEDNLTRLMNKADPNNKSLMDHIIMHAEKRYPIDTPLDQINDTFYAAVKNLVSSHPAFLDKLLNKEGLPVTFRLVKDGTLDFLSNNTDRLTDVQKLWTAAITVEQFKLLHDRHFNNMNGLEIKSPFLKALESNKFKRIVKTVPEEEINREETFDHEGQTITIGEYLNRNPLIDRAIHQLRDGTENINSTRTEIEGGEFNLFKPCVTISHKNHKFELHSDELVYRAIAAATTTFMISFIFTSSFLTLPATGIIFYAVYRFEISRATKALHKAAMEVFENSF
ncbi:MAG: hypothetical protein Tsb0021_05950 [Chlamydiales bacterium]